MAFFQRLRRNLRTSRRQGRSESNRTARLGLGPTPRASKASLVTQPVTPRTPAAAPPRAAVEPVAEVAPAREVTPVADTTPQSPKIDLVALSATPRRSKLPRDVLPDIEYGDAVDSCSNTHEIKSSTSYCSELTDMTQVDDGLTDWGLPKALIPETDLPAPVDIAEDSTDVDLESLFGVDELAQAQAEALTARKETITRTLSVVYLAVLLQRRGVVPKRYQPMRARKSLSELREEAERQQFEQTMLSGPFWM